MSKRHTDASLLSSYPHDQYREPDDHGTKTLPTGILAPNDSYYSELPRSQTEGPPSRVPVSSSANQKPPARSFYHRSSNGTSLSDDAINDIISGVREETAELALRALSDAASLRNNTPPVTRPRIQLTPNVSKTQLKSPDHDISSRESKELSPPNASSERTFEPAILDTRQSSPRSLITSNLTDLSRASPSAAGEDTTRKTDDQGSGIDPAAMTHSFKSTPLSEQTPLLSEIICKQRLIAACDIERQASVDEAPLIDIRLTSTHYVKNVVSCFSELSNLYIWNKKAIWTQGIHQSVRCLPAVFVGVLLNILDALSYGMILFPLGEPLFADLGQAGISMFYISTIVSQLVFNFRSKFRCVVGSEMIEVVPFFHQMAYSIRNKMSEDQPEAILATTVFSFALSSVVTGATFYLMGLCKVGTLMGFFPRHILTGCIGGIGLFLIQTSLEVCAGLDGGLKYNISTFRDLISSDVLVQWFVPLTLAIVLLIAKHWSSYRYLVPIYFSIMFGVFYFFIGQFSIPLDRLRNRHWIFDSPETGNMFYDYLKLYRFGLVHWDAILATVPHMLALTFFGVLHVPINVPALAVLTGEDNIDLDRELKAHGYSNALAGICGSVQNYLVYSNSQLFMQSGGDSRLAGFMLAGATFLVLLFGNGIVGFVPIMIVGAMIYYLGLSLVQEALVDPWGRISLWEHLTILVMMVTMLAYDFVFGIVVGILLACVSLVLQLSRVSAIRMVSTGRLASSTVRRGPIQRRFLEGVGEQVYLLKLAGHLFFGTIVGVENKVRALLEDAFQSEPIRFLVIDLANVSGFDYSATEAFSRIVRMLLKKQITLVMCGVGMQHQGAQGLRNVCSFEVDGARLFKDMNSALEFCENELLKSFYQQSDDFLRVFAERRLPGVAIQNPSPDSSGVSLCGSPRRHRLRDVAVATLQRESCAPRLKRQAYIQPLSLILETFSSVSTKNEDFWSQATRYFVRKEYKMGAVLYKQGDSPDGFYLLERGTLKAEYKYHLPLGQLSEVIVAGTTCGELPFFSNMDRTATTTAERDCALWVLDQAAWEEIQKCHPDIALELLKVSLKLTSERMESIMEYTLLMTSC